MVFLAGTIVEHVNQKSPPMPVPMNRQNVPMQNGSGATTAATGAPNVRKPEDMLPQELTSMSETDLLSYINPSCFDQNGFLM